jgi:hypothetical protein
MSLKEAHDIGEELQKKIERIPEVERVFLNDLICFFSLKKNFYFRHLFISIMNLIIKLVTNIKLFENLCIDCIVFFPALVLYNLTFYVM